jgi:hypothetical protein
MTQASIDRAIENGLVRFQSIEELRFGDCLSFEIGELFIEFCDFGTSAFRTAALEQRGDSWPHPRWIARFRIVRLQSLSYSAAGRRSAR